MRLIIEDDEGRKTIVPFGQDTVTIGRDDGNTVSLKERNVSRKHASLVRQNGSVLIEDLNSFNGVRINGDRIQGRTQVREGDLIQIGDYDLAIERENATEAPPERRTEPSLPPVRAPGYDLPAATTHDTTPPSAQPRPEPTSVIKSPYGPNGELSFDGVSIASQERPRLVLLNTSDRGTEIWVEKSIMSIGRATGPADITIDHRSISKLHARLSREPDGRWRITDLKSANGMRINGEDYGDAPLSPGDVVELGHVQLKFVAPGDRFSLRASGLSGAFSGRRRVVGASVLGACVVIVIGLLSFRHPKEAPKAEDSPPPPRAQQVLAPLPGATPTQPAAPVVPPAPAPEPVDDAAVADAERASQALQQAKVLAKARKWDKADEKLKEAEEVDADDPTVARLRREIDAAKDKEATKEAAKEAAQAAKEAPKEPPVKVARADRKPKAHAAEPAPDSDVPAPQAAPTSKGDRHGKAKAMYEEAISAIGGQDYVGALAKLERAADLDPSLAEAQKGMGICYAKLHQPDKGAYHYEQYLKLNPRARDADDVRKMLQDYYKTRGE